MDDEEDFSSLSLTERWTHSKWNVRQGAYKEAAEAFAKSDSALAPFSADPSLLRAAGTDANVNALDSGVRAVAAFLAYAELAVCTKMATEVLRPMAEKGLAAVKPAVKSATTETILAFVENSQDPSSVVLQVVQVTSHKLPKVIAAATAALAAVYTQFGAQAVDPKPALAVLPKLFAHTDKTVRAEATNLSVALVRYVGVPTMTTVLQEIKPVQLKELQEQFAAAGPAAPTRTLRGAGSNTEVVGPEDEDMEEAEPVEIDPFDLAVAANVLAKIPGDFDKQVASPKWKERKEMLDEVVKVLSVPKMAPDGDYMGVVRGLLPVIAKDANIMCATQAMTAVRLLATGLRSQFARYASRDLVQAVVDRFKEKKASVVEAASEALHALVASTSLAEMFDIVLGSFTSKVPQIKIECAKFVGDELSRCKTVPPPAVLQEVIAAAVKLMGDTQEPVRKQSAVVLGTIMKMIGERPLAAALEPLDDLRKAKVREACESATVAAKVPTKAARPAAPAAKAVPKPGMARPVRKREAPSAAPPVPPPAAPPTATPVKKTGARTVQSAEFTPARQPPAARRRMVSPIKPPVERPLAEPVRQLSPPQETEEMQRAVRRLEDQCESLKVRLEAEQSRREAVEAENRALREQLNAVRQTQQTQHDLEAVNVRMNSMTLESRRISALRPLSRSGSGGSGSPSLGGDEPPHRSHSRLIPIAPPEQPKTPARSPLMAMPAQMEGSPVNQENWRRAAEVTSELKRRIEAMKRQRGAA